MALLKRTPRAEPLPERVEIALGERIVPVRLRANPNARRYTLRLGRGTAEPVVTVPRGGNLGDARSFLERHKLWLLRRLEARPPPRPLADRAIIPVRGIDHTIEHRPGRRGIVSVEPGDDGPVLAVSGDVDHLPRRVTDWLKRQAKADLEIAVFRYAAMVKRKPVAIRIRDQKGRWGSCSSRGTLSFSWRLVLAPPYVLDYLAAHEVVHMREMNHGVRFWRLLREICPDTDHAEAWLKREGAGLHLIGAESLEP